MDFMIEDTQLFDALGSSLFSGVCHLEQVSRNDMRATCIQRHRRGNALADAIRDPEARKLVREHLGLTDETLPTVPASEAVGSKATKTNLYVASINPDGVIHFYQVRAHSIRRMLRRELLNQ